MTEGQLLTLLRSHEADERLVGLMTAQIRTERGTRDPRLLRRASRMLGDEDEDCRWQAGILVALFITDYAERVWRIIRKFAESADSTTRMIVATTLLEHLLEYDQARYEPRAQRLAMTSRYFRDTLSSCWYTGKASGSTKSRP